MTELVLPTYQAGQISTVQRWLSALGDSAIEGYPPLAVLAGCIAVLTGQTAEAQRWAAIVDAASFDLVPADGTASFDSARAMLRAVMCAAGPEQMMTDASVARRPGAAVEPLARHRALLLRRGASARRGRRPGRRAVRRVVRRWPPRIGNTDSFVVSEAELALLAMDRGRWAEAAGHVESGARRHR